MDLSTLCWLFALLIPDARAAEGFVRPCAARFECRVEARFSAPPSPKELDLLPLLFADEEENQDDDELVNAQPVPFEVSSVSTSNLVLRKLLPPPSPVLSSRAARSPPRQV